MKTDSKNEALLNKVCEHWEEYEAEYQDKTDYINQIILGLISLNHQSDFALDVTMYDEDLITEIDGGEMLATFKKNQETIKQIHKLLWVNACGEEHSKDCDEQYNCFATEL